ncbi:MAG: hypothetical protein DLM71_10875 [Chloroflexi bacterium]|nr:MAG: hypothetical protein DLM71_10875 [Chloroflexota bacterium]
MRAMRRASVRGRLRGWSPLLLVLLALFIAACSASTPRPSGNSGVPRQTGVPGTPPGATTSPTVATPAPTGSPGQSRFPLAVVTGFTNLKDAVTVAELAQLARSGRIFTPCDVAIVQPADLAVSGGSCLPANQIASRIAGEPGAIGLLPPGLVEVKTKVLPVDGADLFGSAQARSRPYPIIGTSTVLPPAATSYDAANIRTLMSVGESCPDRGVAQQAITLGRGWGWVFGGGTARYLDIRPNPAPPGHVGNGFNVADIQPTGNAGALWKMIGAADFTVEDFECPVVSNWRVNEGLSFGIDPRVLGYMKRGGTDTVILANNHQTDQGIGGLLESLGHFADAGILQAGAGRDLAQALAPAVYDAHGLRFAVVGWNIVPGVVAAGPNQPGVAWMTDANIRESVRLARAAGDVVVCMPQWGFPEYHVALQPEDRAIQQQLIDAGCDVILGHGPHWAGEIDLFRRTDGGVLFSIYGHGNFLFGQDWAQESQEGVLPELTFSGTRLVNVRLHPYAMYLQAQANLTDPQGDGRYVLRRVLGVSRLAY